MKEQKTLVVATPADRRDSSLLAALDVQSFDGDTMGREEYMTARQVYWTGLLETEASLPDREKTIFIVKEGYLYIGWGRRVLNEAQQPTLEKYFSPGRDEIRGTEALMKRAGVSLDPLPAPLERPEQIKSGLLEAV